MIVDLIRRCVIVAAVDAAVLVLVVALALNI